MENNLEPTSEVNKDKTDKNNNSNTNEVKEPKSEKIFNINENKPGLENNSASKVVKKNENDTPAKPITKQKKELPIEKKPFQEFINLHLIPSLIEEINQEGTTAILE